MGASNWDAQMVAVNGFGMTRFGRRQDGSSFRDWAKDAFESALSMAELDLGDVDALVVAGESDFFTLQLNPAGILASDLGLVGCPAFRVEGGGASGQLAVHAGVARVMAGLSRHVAIVGVDTTASTLSGDRVRDLYGFSFDGWTDGMTGVTATALYALSWGQFAGEMGLGEAELAQVAIDHRANARRNPKAHLPRSHTVDEIAASPLIASPYRRLHCSPLSDGAAAIILSCPDLLPGGRRNAPRVAGIGAASDRAALGARSRPGHFEAKRIAMMRACAMAGIAPRQVGLAEVYDAYAGAALQGLHALGLSEAPGRDMAAGQFRLEGRLPVNLSGGLLGQGAAPGATGIAQTGTVAALLEGRYFAGAQPSVLPRHGVADTHGGVCTLSAVTILCQPEAA
jgi:acetyl-CoA C-acetyltransferase